MKYRNPKNVLSPRDAIKDVQVIFDGGEDSISVAKVKWYDDYKLGIRWNVALREWDNNEKKDGKECLGMPTSTGHPVWFIIPDDFLDKESDLWKEIEKGIAEFENKK
jgi:hypothetical protein